MLDFKSHLTNTFLIEAKVDEFVNRYMRGWEDHPLVKADPQEARRRIAGAHGIGNSHHQNVYLTGELLNGTYRPEEDVPTMRQIVGLHDKAVKFGHAKKEDIADHTHDSLSRFFDDLESRDERFDDSEPPKPGNPKLPGMDKYHIGTITPHPKSERKRINPTLPIHVYHIHHEDIRSPSEYGRIAKVIGKNCPRNSNICVRNNPTYLENYSQGHGFLMYVQGGRVVRAHGNGDRGMVDHKNRMILEKSPEEHEHLIGETLKLMSPERKAVYGIHMVHRPVVVSNRDGISETHNPTPEDKKQRINHALGNMGPYEIISLYKKAGRKFKRDVQKAPSKDLYYPVNPEHHDAVEEYSRKSSDILVNLNRLVKHHLEGDSEIKGTNLADPKVIKHIGANYVSGGKRFGFNPSEHILENLYVNSPHFDAEGLSKLIKKNKDSIRKQERTRRLPREERMNSARINSSSKYDWQTRSFRQLSQPVRSTYRLGRSMRGQRISSEDDEGGYYHSAQPGYNGLETLAQGAFTAHEKNFITPKHVDDIFKLGPQAHVAQDVLIRNKSPHVTPKHMDQYLDVLMSRKDLMGDDIEKMQGFLKHPSHTREHVDRIMKSAHVKQLGVPGYTHVEEHYMDHFAQALRHSPHITHDEISHFINHPDLHIPYEERHVDQSKTFTSNEERQAAGKEAFIKNDRYSRARRFQLAAASNPNATDEHVTQFLKHNKTNGVAQTRHFLMGQNESETRRKLTPEQQHLVVDTFENQRVKHNVKYNQYSVSAADGFLRHMDDPSAIHRVITGNKQEADQISAHKVLHDLLRYNPHLNHDHLDSIENHTFDFTKTKDDTAMTNKLRQSVQLRRDSGNIPLLQVERKKNQSEYYGGAGPRSSYKGLYITSSPPRPRVGERGTPEYKMRKPRRFEEGFLSFGQFLLKS